MHNGFASELKRFGPYRSYQAPCRADAQQYCNQLARNHYENFTVATMLLPRHLIRHFHTVYAYCRWADDLADETGGGPETRGLLHWWREELLRCYHGAPRHPVMVALRETIRDFDIPAQPFLDLLTAFEQDQLVTRYQTYEQLLGYCRNSANPVGHLVLYLCGCYSAENAALSDDVCTALQLANFWQDLARDLDIGRIYIPEEDCRRFGLELSDVSARRRSPAFAGLMRFEVERTRALFFRGLPLITRLPEEVQPDIELFIRFGLAILRKIERCDYNVWTVRPVISRWEKAAMVGRFLLQRLGRHFS